MTDFNNNKYLFQLFNVVLILASNFIKSIQEKMTDEIRMRIFRMDQLALFVSKMMSRLLILLDLKNKEIFESKTELASKVGSSFEKKMENKSEWFPTKQEQNKEKQNELKKGQNKSDYCEDLLMVYFNLAQYISQRILLEKEWLDSLQNSMKHLSLINQFFSSLSCKSCNCNNCICFAEEIEKEDLTLLEKDLITNRVVHQIVNRRSLEMEEEECLRLTQRANTDSITRVFKKVKSICQFDLEFANSEAKRVFFTRFKIKKEKMQRFEWTVFKKIENCPMFLRKIILFKLKFILTNLKNYYAEDLNKAEPRQPKHDSLVNHIHNKYFQFQRDDRFQVLLRLEMPIPQKRKPCDCNFSDCRFCKGSIQVKNIAGFDKMKKETFGKKNFIFQKREVFLPKIEKNTIDIKKNGKNKFNSNTPETKKEWSVSNTFSMNKNPIKLPRISNNQGKFQLRNMRSYRSIDNLINNKYILNFNKDKKANRKKQLKK